MGAPFEIPEACEARALYLRRALMRVAEDAAAMLDALDLPQTEALALAIATLDAFDGDPDFEPCPGYDEPEGDDERCASEHDGSEPEDGGEPHLSVVGWDGQGDRWRRSGAQTIGCAADRELVGYEEMPHAPRPPAVYRSTIQELRRRACALQLGSPALSAWIGGAQ